MGRTGGWEASKHLRVKQTIKRKKETKKTNSTNKQWPPQRPRNAKKNVSRSHEKLATSRPKRTENRPRSDLGRFGRIKVVQGTPADAAKTAQERSKTRPGRLKIVPGRPKTSRGASKMTPGPLTSRTGGHFERYSAATASHECVLNDFPTAGCCENHSFCCVSPL